MTVSNTTPTSDLSDWEFSERKSERKFKLKKETWRSLIRREGIRHKMSMFSLERPNGRVLTDQEDVAFGAVQTAFTKTVL